MNSLKVNHYRKNKNYYNINSNNEQLNIDNNPRKLVKNLDFFNNSKKKNIKTDKTSSHQFQIKLTFSKINSWENLFKLKNNICILHNKYKCLNEEIEKLKREKFNIIKSLNFFKAVNFFNQKNNHIINNFKEILKFIKKAKDNNNLGINKNISILENLNTTKELLVNKINYLKNKYQLNSMKLCDLIKLKHSFNKKKNNKLAPKSQLYWVSNTNLKQNNSITDNSSSSLSNMEEDCKGLKNSSKLDNSKNIKTIQNINPDNKLDIKKSQKRMPLNDYTILNIDILNLNKTNNEISISLENLLKKESELKYKINIKEEDVKSKNKIILDLSKLEKKIKKKLIRFLKEEIEFGFDIKNNGIFWIYFELIKLKEYDVEIFPEYLSYKFHNYFINIINNLVVIFKQKKKLNNIKIFNKLFSNNDNIIIEDKKINIKFPLHLKETEKIRCSQNLWSFKKRFKSDNFSINSMNPNKYKFICDQNYKVPKLTTPPKLNYYSFGKNIINKNIIKNKNLVKLKEINQNIKFIDDDNTVVFTNIKSLNNDKKEVFYDIQKKYEEIKILIDNSKSYFKKNIKILSKKHGQDQIVKIITCLHGESFYKQIINI